MMQLENDPYIRCFQEEYAVVAIPIKRLKQTLEELEEQGLLLYFSEERRQTIKQVLDYEQRDLHIMTTLFLG